MNIVRCIALLALSACTATPIYNPSKTIPALSSWQEPACLLLCTIHMSLIRDEATSLGSGAISGGTNSTSSSSTNSGTGKTQ